MSSGPNAIELRKLIAEDGCNELKCRPFLDDALEMLADRTAKGFDKPFYEQQLISGRCDYLITGTFYDDGDHNEKCAYLWELKAPQEPLFTKTTHRLVLPSRAFTKGLAQLYNFHYDVVHSKAYGDYIGDIDPRNIRLGGLIIGSTAKLFSNVKPTDSDYEGLKTRAFRIMRRYTSEPHSMRVYTWDQVADFMEGGKTKSKPEGVNVTEVASIIDQLLGDVRKWQKGQQPGDGS